ncbi:MAG: YtpR family tRNA-binding protein, partial [bacterium]
MNISYSWLKEIVPDMKMEPEGVAEHLASRGAPVDIKGGGGVGLGSVVVGRVKSVKKHPNADRLSICEVDNGKEILQVICGAPVIKEGGHYPFAGVGSELPNGMKLRKAKIRGEFSNGMLCSEMELDLGIDQSGIMLLPESVSPGEPLIEVLSLGEVILEVEVTPNRGDCFSVLGVAREVC